MTAVTTLRTPDSTGIEKMLSPLRQEAEQLEVTDAGSHERAQQLLVHYKTIDTDIGKLYDDEVSMAHKLHKSLTTKRSALLAVTDFARKHISRKMDVYEAAERRRVATEQKRLADEATARDRERQEFEAAAAEAAGDTQAAEEIRSEPVQPVVVHVPELVGKVEGVQKQGRWSAEIVDKKAFILHVADKVREGDESMLAYLDPNMPNLNRLAVSLKAEMRVPGVQAVEKTVRPVKATV